MKKNIFAMTLAALSAMPMMAQETYESAQIATEDLNGTARYVGMGGAMEALGADISTMGTNPAGIGLFRRSSFYTSFGFSSLPKAKSSNNNFNSNIEGKTPVSFDQIGFVYSTPTSKGNYVNIGFNFNKSRNFNEVLTAANSLKSASQNKGSYIKGLKGFYDNDNNYTQNDALLWENVILDEHGDASYYEADGYCFSREQKGYIGEYNFNISGNQNDRIYWGLTIGLKDVNYDNFSYYTEYLNKATGEPNGMLESYDERTITGTGWNLKGGIIVRPVEESPFRFGLSIATPTWYELESSNYTDLAYSPDDNANNLKVMDHLGEATEYKVFTPWKFGASLGHTFGQDLALGLSYEFADYGSIDNRVITDEYYDSWNDTYSTDSESDRAMNSNTKQSLKGVHTLKFGFEGKLSPEFAVRAGYNYVSPMYSKNGVRSTILDAYGTYYSSTTNYTNWKDTHRVTVGIGYNHKNFSLDLAYQYSCKNGDFYPFEPLSCSDFDSNNQPYTETNYAGATEVKNERHQFLMTLGWRF